MSKRINRCVELLEQDQAAIMMVRTPAMC